MDFNDLSLENHHLRSKIGPRVTNIAPLCSETIGKRSEMVSPASNSQKPGNNGKLEDFSEKSRLSEIGVLNNTVDYCRTLHKTGPSGRHRTGNGECSTDTVTRLE